MVRGKERKWKTVAGDRTLDKALAETASFSLVGSLHMYKHFKASTSPNLLISACQSYATIATSQTKKIP